MKKKDLLNKYNDMLEETRHDLNEAESRLKSYKESKEYYEAYLISCGDFSKYYLKFWTLKHFIRDLEDLE